MKILQIMAFPQTGKEFVPLELPDVPGRQPDRFNAPQIIGMALVEDQSGTRSVEWVTWIPETRRIQVTDHYFQHFR